jgi:hypothetical protein
MVIPLFLMKIILNTRKLFYAYFPITKPDFLIGRELRDLNGFFDNISL